MRFSDRKLAGDRSGDSKKILGVTISDISESLALAKISSWLGENRSTSRLVVTVGPEFLLTAQKDEQFRQILNAADLALPDGFGLQLYAGIKNRVPGTDLAIKLCQLAAKGGWTIGLLGGQTGIAKKTTEKLREKFPGIKILAAVDGVEADRILSGSDTINTSKQVFDILFVAFGHPKQEKLLWRLRGKFRVGMGVGGAFDYISGVVPRPPKFLRTLGLEWLWRLFLQPWRLRRVLNATIVFPIMLFWNRGKIRS